jgi:hypothetical protein
MFVGVAIPFVDCVLVFITFGTEAELGIDSFHTGFLFSGMSADQVTQDQ